MQESAEHEAWVVTTTRLRSPACIQKLQLVKTLVPVVWMEQILLLNTRLSRGEPVGPAGVGWEAAGWQNPSSTQVS